MPFVDVDSEIWTNALKELQFDFYQLPDYCKIESDVLKVKLVYWYI